MKKIKNWNQDEILSGLHELVKLKGNCIGVVIDCNTCPLSDFRTEKNESGSICTPTTNVETATQIIRELEATELMNML